MTIYEINDQIEQFFLQNIDEETGEILNPEKFSELELLREEKIENIALYLKNVRATSEAIKAEKLALAERQARLEKKAESLQKLLEWACEGEKFETGKVSISYRKSNRLVIDDTTGIPLEYFRVKTEVDKTRIKDALKKGVKIDGCYIETVQNIQVK